jgi:hypothetical protein
VTLPVPVGLVLLVATARRRRRNPFTLDDDRDVRENIVRYDDEGGGEEDTEAFDMAALRHLNATRDGEGAGTRRYDNAPELLAARYREPQHNATVAMAPPPPTAVEVETEVAPPAGGLEAGPLEAGPMGAGPGVHWADAGPDGHACWHSARVRKLLLLPWQFPYQKWTHLPAMTS